MQDFYIPDDDADVYEQIEEVLYPLQPKQQVASDTYVKFRFYGGAKGGGKSYWLRSEVARLASSAPGVRGLVLRRTFPEVYENTVIPMRKELPNEMFVYNESKGIMRYTQTSTITKFQSTVKFSYCRNLKDVLNYQGIEYDFIAIEELTHWTEIEFQILMSCLRSSRRGIQACFFGTSNPGGIGHLWVKRVFVDRQFTATENPNHYSYIPATIYDNKVLMDANPDYEEGLKNLPEEEKKAYLEGDWNVFKGQYFKDWLSSIHVIEPFKIPWNWKKIICLDYGYTNPSAVYRLAIDQDGVVYVYRELYVTKMLYNELVEEVKARNGEDVKILIADPALKTKSPDTGISFFDIAGNAGFDIIPGINDRVPGWILFKSLLRIREDEKKGRITGIYFFLTCSDAIRTIPTLIHDERNVEDLNTEGEDHSADAIRYGLQFIKNIVASLISTSNINKKGRDTPKGKRKIVRIIKKRF